MKNRHKVMSIGILSGIVLLFITINNKADTVFADAPAITLTSIISNNTNNTATAKAGDTISVSFTSDKYLSTGNNNSYISSVFANVGPGSYEITRGNDGNLYVPGATSGSIIRITADGTVSTFATFPNPYKIIFDPIGDAYVTDSSNNIVVKVTSGGAVSTFAEVTQNPNGIIRDPVTGDFYVTTQVGSDLTKYLQKELFHM